MPCVTVTPPASHYEQHGSGPDLVFLHGAGGNHLVWWQVAAFSREFRCTTFDARGWGLSRGEMAVGRFSLGTDLVALLERLDIGRAHIIAQSMGGRAVAGLSPGAATRAFPGALRHHCRGNRRPGA
ncbi:alpha/beta fold hydrolase [Candidatus Amarobacter glycogenicus]|uniref:alpha/beta fold hydrolase n=1 Tax=Candidatus Amarobacter glycogenicus TaxID=3140699 RepID=UPI003136180C|nr:alpha/beta fold hydrolase [Dehalococcoidia bacterium]